MAETLRDFWARIRDRTAAHVQNVDWPDVDVASYIAGLRAGQTPARARPQIRFSHVITAPVIYSLIIPFVILDLFVSLYQAICFRAYGIPRVARGDYIVMDRHRLAHLNLPQKINCAYCAYANGLIAYVGEIAARTEAYWCPVKHAARMAGVHDHYQFFMEYGDTRGFVEKREASRDRLSGTGGSARAGAGGGSKADPRPAKGSAAAQADDDVDLG